MQGKQILSSANASQKDASFISRLFFNDMVILILYIEGMKPKHSSQPLTASLIQFCKVFYQPPSPPSLLTFPLFAININKIFCCCCKIYILLFPSANQWSLEHFQLCKKDFFSLEEISILL